MTGLLPSLPTYPESAEKALEGYINLGLTQIQDFSDAWSLSDLGKEADDRN